MQRGMRHVRSGVQQAITPGKRAVQAMINADARLGGTVDDLTAPQEWVEASANFVRCVLHHNL
jgi:hypothetical protein